MLLVQYSGTLKSEQNRKMNMPAISFLSLHLSMFLYSDALSVAPVCKIQGRQRWRQERNHPRLSALPAQEAVSSLHHSSLLLSEGAELKQFVPLATALLVIGDIALGSPAVKAITSMLYGDLQDGNMDSMHSSYSGSINSPQDALPSKSRIDVEASTLEALNKAAEALERAKLSEEMRPQKGSVEAVRKRLERQMKDLKR